MTSIGEKVAHVKAAPNTGDHHCHWPNCTAKVKPAFWGCTRHWYTLPTWIRSKIWRTYKPGQEAAKNPTTDYLDAAREAQDWIKGYLQAFPPAPEQKRLL